MREVGDTATDSQWCAMMRNETREESNLSMHVLQKDLLFR